MRDALHHLSPLPAAHYPPPKPHLLVSLRPLLLAYEDLQVYEDEDILYIIMELLKGPDLFGARAGG